MKPMMALSMTFASPVAMKPPRAIASQIGSWQRAPTSASLGINQRTRLRLLGTMGAGGYSLAIRNSVAGVVMASRVVGAKAVTVNDFLDGHKSQGRYLTVWTN